MDPEKTALSSYRLPGAANDRRKHDTPAVNHRNKSRKLDPGVARVAPGPAVPPSSHPILQPTEFIRAGPQSKCRGKTNVEPVH